MTSAIVAALIVGAVEVIAGGGMTPERIAELRLIYRFPTLGWASMNEALDEIERLTDECAATRSDFANALSRHAADQAETERLRTELRDCLVIVANAGRAQGTAEAMCDTLEQRCQEAEREVERLRAGIKGLIAGDEHKPHPTMRDKCVHERWNYDGVCDFCQEEYLQNLLDGGMP